MFGIYSNKRLTESERNVLNSNPDDYNWYCVIVQSIFKNGTFFQVREDIKLPQKEDDNGVVLFFEREDVVYLKSIDGEVADEEVESILEVCKFLLEKFGRPITAYIPCRPFEKINVDVVKDCSDITMIFSYIKVDNGEKIIERLENKLLRNEKFTVPDSIDHMLLPYTGYKNKEVFEEKFKHYMGLIESFGAD